MGKTKLLVAAIICFTIAGLMIGGLAYDIHTNYITEDTILFQNQ